MKNVYRVVDPNCVFIRWGLQDRIFFNPLCSAAQLVLGVLTGPVCFTFGITWSSTLVCSETTILWMFTTTGVCDNNFGQLSCNEIEITVCGLDSILVKWQDITQCKVKKKSQ